RAEGAARRAGPPRSRAARARAPASARARFHPAWWYVSVTDHKVSPPLTHGNEEKGVPASDLGTRSGGAHADRRSDAGGARGKRERRRPEPEPGARAEDVLRPCGGRARGSRDLLPHLAARGPRKRPARHRFLADRASGLP